MTTTCTGPIKTMANERNTQVNTCVYTNNNAPPLTHRLHFEKFLWTISLLWEVQQRDHILHIFFSTLRRPSIFRSHGILIHQNPANSDRDTHTTQIRISQKEKKGWICLNSNNVCNRKSSLTKKNNNFFDFICYPGWLSQICECVVCLIHCHIG